MKVYVNRPGENWIVDRFAQEFYADNPDICTHNPYDADVIWLLADWSWRQIPIDILQKKHVMTSIHHIVPEKFGEKERWDFTERDKVTNLYHVPNEHTESFVSQLTDRPIVVAPYWANDKIWRVTGHSSFLRAKYRVPQNAYVVGSFQRDTEGAGISNGIYLPKLEKGPDLFCDYVEALAKTRQDIYVVLAGWRRQYVIQRLKNAGIKHTYIELPDQPTVNELYQTLDIYPVTARYEGGPQSLVECGMLGVPMVSTPVGISSHVLPTASIKKASELLQAVPTIPDVSRLLVSNGGYEPFITALRSLT